MDFVKNPIILGALAGLITYGYFYYDAQKHKDDPEIKQNKVPILAPCVVAVIIWFVTSCYFDSCCETVKVNILSPKLPNISKGSDISTRSYHLVGKNKIRLPSNDVFIDIANFD